MRCFNYTFDHDLYKCDNKKSLLEPCLVLVYFLFSLGNSKFKNKVNELLKLYIIKDSVNFTLEYVILYIKLEDYVNDYKIIPLFLEFSKIPWQLNMLAIVVLNIILTIDAGCHTTYFKPLVYLIMTLHPSLGLDYNIINQLATIGIFLLALNIKYRPIDKILNYNIKPYKKLQKVIEIVYYTSQCILTGIIAQSITNNLLITTLILTLPYKAYLE